MLIKSIRSRCIGRAADMEK